MSFHRDLLAQATHLAGLEATRPKQASLRRAISAAYYAVFHLLVAEGTKTIRPATIRVHVRRLYEHGNMKLVCKNWAKGAIQNLPAQTAALVTAPISVDLQTVASAFVDLQEARHTADYDLSQTFTRAEALSYVTLASQAFTAWDTARASNNASIFLAALLFEKHWKGR